MLNPSKGEEPACLFYPSCEATFAQTYIDRDLPNSDSNVRQLAKPCSGCALPIRLQR